MAKGVEIALCSVRVGSVCWLRVRGVDYGYSDTRRPAGVQASDALFFRIRVVRQEKEKNLHQMTADDKIAYCLQSERTAEHSCCRPLPLCLPLTPLSTVCPAACPDVATSVVSCSCNDSRAPLCASTRRR